MSGEGRDRLSLVAPYSVSLLRLAEYCMSTQQSRGFCLPSRVNLAAAFKTHVFVQPVAAAQCSSKVVLAANILFLLS